jgi:hypothetical protein
MAVAPGARVVVFGGTLGILPVLAAQAGAVVVDVVDHAAQLDAVDLVAVANHVRDRVRLVEGHPSTVALEAPADVAVTAAVGPLGLMPEWDEWCSRHLRPGGVRVPSSIRRYSAPVDAPELLASILNGSGGYGVALEALREAAIGRLRQGDLNSANIGPWVECGAHSGSRAGPSGLALGLEIEVCPGVCIDTRSADGLPPWCPSWLPAALERPCDVRLTFSPGGVQAAIHGIAEHSWVAPR